MSDGALRVPIHYDFASSLCYVAHRVLQRLGPELDALGVVLDWTPLDLAGLLNWRRGGLVSRERRSNAERVARELGVALTMPERWIDSRLAMAIALAEKRPERQATWRERVFSAVFEAGLGEALPTRALALARELGIQPSQAAIDTGLAELEARTRAAGTASVAGAPTLMLGEWPIAGIHDDATMLSILGRHALRAREQLAGKDPLH